MSLWIQVDQNNNLLQGPTFLTGELLRMDLAERNAQGWYACTAPNIDYDPRYAIQTGYEFSFNGNDSVVSFTNVWRDIDYLKRLRKEDVNEYRAAWLRGGYEFEGVLYDSDEQAQRNITAVMVAINAGYTLPPEFLWRAVDNSTRTFDNASYRTFFLSASFWVEEVYKVSWYHKAQIDALTTPEAVVGYDITTGWSKTNMQPVAAPQA